MAGSVALSSIAWQRAGQSPAGCRCGIVAHNGPAGIHDLMHGISPVYVLVPAQRKSIGTAHLRDFGLGATGARYWRLAWLEHWNEG